MKHFFSLMTLLTCMTATAGTYFTKEEGVTHLFPNHHHTDPVWHGWDEVPPQIKERLQNDKELQGVRMEGELLVLRVLDAENQLLGWAVITEEMGKHKPLTMMVALEPNGQVAGVLLTIFRESRGYGIKHKKFQKQFQGKGKEDPVTVGIDIAHVSGSTISSRSMALGVRKVLRMMDAYGIASNH